MSGKYGEPWTATDDGQSAITATGANLLRLEPTSRRKCIVRAVACVNAIAGLNPAAIPELIAAADQMLNEGGWEGVQHRLRSALAAVRRQA